MLYPQDGITHIRCAETADSVQTDTTADNSRQRKLKSGTEKEAVQWQQKTVEIQEQMN